MVESRVGADVVKRSCAAGLGVFGAEDDSVDPSHQGCPCAHGARFEGGDEGGPDQMRRSGDLAGDPQSQNLGMRSRVVAELAFVVCR